MNSLISQCVNHYRWTTGYAELVYKEYEKFIALRAENEKLSPCDDIDRMWHQHILNTANYASFCQQKVGKFVHHDANDAMDQNARLKRLENTITAYRAKYGLEHPLVWGTTTKKYDVFANDLAKTPKNPIVSTVIGKTDRELIEESRKRFQNVRVTTDTLDHRKSVLLNQSSQTGSVPLSANTDERKSIANIYSRKPSIVELMAKDKNCIKTFIKTEPVIVSIVIVKTFEIKEGEEYRQIVKDEKDIVKIRVKFPNASMVEQLEQFVAKKMNHMSQAIHVGKFAGERIAKGESVEVKQYVRNDEYLVDNATYIAICWEPTRSMFC